jgi:membrane-bound ClpP family serine protease
MSNSNNSSSGIGVAGLLGVAFVILKLTEVIDWSWWYVTLPFWGGIIIVLGVLAIAGIVFLISNASKKRNKTKETYHNPYKIPKQSMFQKRMEEMEAKRNNLQA